MIALHDTVRLPALTFGQRPTIRAYAEPVVPTPEPNEDGLYRFVDKTCGGKRRGRRTT